MPWVRFDDGYLTNMKVLRAGRDGRDLHQACVFYAARELTDGFIPTEALPLIATMAGVPDYREAIARCESAIGPSGKGLLEPVEGGYAIHDYLAYNPSREQVEHTRQVRAEAGSRGGKQKASNLLESGYKHASSKTLAKVCPVPVPVPISTPKGVVASDEPTAAPAPAVLTMVRPVPKPREREKSWIERHPLFEPLVAIPEIGRPAGDAWSLYGKAVKALDELGATPEEVPRRAENYPLVMGSKPDGTPIPLTLTSLVKHWNLCGHAPRAQPKEGRNGELLGPTQDDRRRAEERQRADQEAYRAALAGINGARAGSSVLGARPMS